MSELTTVHLVRHGEVDNPEGVLYGRLPGYVLSPAGTTMAINAAGALSDRDIAAVASSPLERARQTADPIAEKFGLQVRVDERLVESVNVFEGSRLATARDLLRTPWHVLRHAYNPLRPSWGEAYDDVAHRMLDAIDDIRVLVRGREAVCVSHQLPIWVARRALEGRSLWHHPRHRLCALGSITSLRYVDDELVSIGYSEPSGGVARHDPAPRSDRRMETPHPPDAAH